MNAKIVLTFVVIILLTAHFVARAQRVDPDYIANAETDMALDGISGSNNVLLPLADRKLLALLNLPGAGRVLIRIDANGGHDPSFNCAACNFDMRSIAVQPEGKYLVGGTSNNSPRILRLNTNGSLDQTFANPFASEQGTATVYTVTPSGQIYASSSGSGDILRRLNSDGSFDNSFTPRTLGATSTVLRIMAQADGKVLVAGSQLPDGILFRLNADGSIDSGWTVPALSDGTSPPQSPAVFLTDALLQADGKVVITGQFGKVNGVSRRNIARLNPDSTVDGASASGLTWGDNPYSRVVVQSDGKLILYIDTQQASGGGFRRLNTDLTIDTSFSFYFAFGSPMVMVAGSNDQLTFIGNGFLTRLNTNGTRDNAVSFRYRIGGAFVTAVAVQSDGKAVVAGNFKFLSGTYQQGVGRLNPDGTGDSSFVSQTSFGSSVSSLPSKIAVQPDGKVIAFGNFTSPRPRLARFNTDGSLDTSFVPNVSGVNTIAVQPDGKILLFGGNMVVNGSSRPGLGRLNSDGTLDIPFSPLLVSPDIKSGVVHPDGRITIAGTFTSVNGINRSNLARLNSDGSVDMTLNAGNLGPLSKIVLTPAGQYIISRTGNPALYRVNSDGLVDPSFAPSGNDSNIGTILPAGRGVIVCGTGTGGIGRVRADGTIDSTFLPGQTLGGVLDLAGQADGKVLAVGTYSGIGGSVRASIARIIVPGTPFDFDGGGRADFMVTRPSDYNWHLLTNGPYNYTATHFGTSGDKVVPADYDGDGRTDMAIWRPSNGDWWWQASSTGVVSFRNHGTNGDTPMPSDTDGDGRADLVLVTTEMLWKGVKASTGETIVYHQFGQAGDTPVTGDFDGDRRGDLAYFRPSNGTWYYVKSSSGASLQVGTVQWGLSTDIPAPADYDGDDKTDVAVYRPSEGNWYVLKSGGGYLIVHFGTTGDRPIPADYDGDGKADVAVFRPSDGYWYQLPTTGGYTGLPWGIGSDIPSPNALLP